MIVIVTAMDKEYDLIREWLMKSDMQNTVLFKTGIGKVNAAIGLTDFLSSVANDVVTRVISVGCAGAAVAGLKPGNVVIGNSYCYHDVYCGEPNANGQVQGMPAVFPSDFSWIDMDERFRLGTIATGDKFVTTREQYWRLRISFLIRITYVLLIWSLLPSRRYATRKGLVLRLFELLAIILWSRTRPSSMQVFGIVLPKRHLVLFVNY